MRKRFSLKLFASHNSGSVGVDEDINPKIRSNDHSVIIPSNPIRSSVDSALSKDDEYFIREEYKAILTFLELASPVIQNEMSKPISYQRAQVENFHMKKDVLNLNANVEEPAKNLIIKFLNSSSIDTLLTIETLVRTGSIRWINEFLNDFEIERDEITKDWKINSPTTTTTNALTTTTTTTSNHTDNNNSPVLESKKVISMNGLKMLVQALYHLIHYDQIVFKHFYNSNLQNNFNTNNLQNNFLKQEEEERMIQICIESLRTICQMPNGITKYLEKLKGDIHIVFLTLLTTRAVSTKSKIFALLTCFINYNNNTNSNSGENTRGVNIIANELASLKLLKIDVLQLKNPKSIGFNRFDWIIKDWKKLQTFEEDYILNILIFFNSLLSKAHEIHSPLHNIVAHELLRTGVLGVLRDLKTKVQKKLQMTKNQIQHQRSYSTTTTNQTSNTSPSSLVSAFGVSISYLQQEEEIYKNIETQALSLDTELRKTAEKDISNSAHWIKLVDLSNPTQIADAISLQLTGTNAWDYFQSILQNLFEFLLINQKLIIQDNVHSISINEDGMELFGNRWSLLENLIRKSFDRKDGSITSKQSEQDNLIRNLSDVIVELENNLKLKNQEVNNLQQEISNLKDQLEQIHLAKTIVEEEKRNDQPITTNIEPIINNSLEEVNNEVNNPIVTTINEQEVNNIEQEVTTIEKKEKNEIINEPSKEIKESNIIESIKIERKKFSELLKSNSPTSVNEKSEISNILREIFPTSTNKRSSIRNSNRLSIGGNANMIITKLKVGEGAIANVIGEYRFQRLSKYFTSLEVLLKPKLKTNILQNNNYILLSNAIKEMNEDIINKNVIDLLQQCLPNKEEMNKLNDQLLILEDTLYTNMILQKTRNHLEAFLCNISPEVPDLLLRISTWKFKYNFNEMVEQIEKKLNLFEDSLNCIISSKKFKSILNIVHLTYQYTIQQTQGELFTSSTLGKLHQFNVNGITFTKSNQQQSLLQWIVQIISQKYSNLLDFYEELTQIDNFLIGEDSNENILNLLKSSIQNIHKNIGDCEYYITILNQLKINDPYIQIMKSFTEIAIPQLTKLEKRFNELENTLKEITKALHYSDTEEKTLSVDEYNQLLYSISTFIKQFKLSISGLQVKKNRDRFVEMSEENNNNLVMSRRFKE
ncbi:hypothetical protein ABK040_010018 [Willaertia magna]